MTLPELALDAIKKYITDSEVIECPEEILRGYPEAQGCFVGIHLLDDSLRGCIGTILPTKQFLGDEIIANAIAAATRDNRFEPISNIELDNLKVSVDVLSAPTIVENMDMLDPKRFGIIVSADDGRSGVLLPDLPGVNTVLEQIKTCLQKGNIDEGEDIKIQSFESKRYE
jgi:AmmeMemoRadiSam system protein A